MTWLKMPNKIVIQLGSKLQFAKYITITNIIHFCRFGTSIRKDLKREDWPGPGDTDVPTYTKGGRKPFLRKDTFWPE